METLRAHEARARLEREGWQVKRSGKHITYAHPEKPGAIISLSHGREKLSPGVMMQIARAAGWKWPPR